MTQPLLSPKDQGNQPSHGHPISPEADAIDRLGEIINTMFEWFKSHANFVTKTDLKEMETRILMNQAELAAGLKTITAQVGKVAAEQATRFDTLTAKIKELTDIINAGGDVTQEVTDALTEVQTALQSLDDTIPDAPAPTP